MIASAVGGTIGDMALLADLFERYLNHPVSLLATARTHGVVVPHDTNNTTLAIHGITRPRALYFKSAGNVAIEDDNGVQIIYAVDAKSVLNVSPKKVLATGTTVSAGDIIGWI